MDKMTPREALDGIKKAKDLFEDTFYDGMIKVLESLVLAAEQVPTLEKLGYKKLDNLDKETRLIYSKDDALQVIEFIHYTYPKNEWGVTKRLGRNTYIPFDELLACAEAIKEMEKEKV